jgi:hypothetical protein
MRAILLALALVLSVRVISAGGATTSRSIVGPARIGAFDAMKDGSYRAAVRAFGRPTTIVGPGHGKCTATWKSQALRVRFYSLGGGSGRCGFSSSGEARSHPWATPRGLEVGAPLAALRGLYPHARLHDGQAFAGRGAWWLVTRHYAVGSFDYPALYARVAHGKVVALGISYPAGGD